MAKRKHAAALFEVIHSGQHSPKSLLKTPRWWFKKRDEEQKKSVALQAKVSAPVIAPESSESSAESSENDPTLGRDAMNLQIAPLRSRALEASLTEEPTSGAHATEPRPARPGSVKLAVNAERQQITFKVSYTSAIIVTFSVLVAVGLAYLVGQKMSRGPQIALGGQSSEQLRAGPKNPDVLDVGARNSGANVPVREPEAAITSRGPENNPDNVEQPAGTTVADPNGTAPSQPQKRVLNLNYVIMQSYPDQKSAEEARDALIKAGIPCTIEKLKNWKDWYSVVGLQGFQRASGTEFDTYIRKIDSASQQFSQRKRSFKAFQPMAYKWVQPG